MEEEQKPELTEFEKIQKELEKIEDTKKSIVRKCPICNHDNCEDINDYYIMCDKDLDRTAQWIYKTYYVLFENKDLKNHFKKDIVDEKTKYEVDRKIKIQELQKRSFTAEKITQNRIIMIQEMAWERMVDIYTSTKNELADDTSKAWHIKQSKEFCDLGKMFREYYQLQMELLGMGKTEEEQKSIMQNYLSGFLKQAVKLFDGNPDAQEKLKLFINSTLSPDAAQDEFTPTT